MKKLSDVIMILAVIICLGSLSMESYAEEDFPTGLIEMTDEEYQEFLENTELPV